MSDQSTTVTITTRRMADFQNAARAIGRWLAPQIAADPDLVLTIGIDGRQGIGKSTFAFLIAEEILGTSIPRPEGQKEWAFTVHTVKGSKQRQAVFLDREGIKCDPQQRVPPRRHGGLLFVQHPYADEQFDLRIGLELPEKMTPWLERKLTDYPQTQRRTARKEIFAKNPQRAITLYLRTALTEQDRKHPLFSPQNLPFKPTKSYGLQIG